MVAKTVAIIPARGGSKRIPKKNIIDFLGEPMITKTIKAAIASGCFEKVIVSTDSQEIADVSLKSGAEVPFLRTECSDDFSNVSDVIIHVLNVLQEKGEVYSNVVSLMPNCPLRDSADICSMYDEFSKSNSDFLLSGFAYGYSNPWWAHYEEENTHKPLFPQQNGIRSQDLGKLLCPTGAIWIAKTQELFKSGTFYGPGYKFFELSYINSVDIDDYDDLKLAKAFSLIKEDKI